MRGSVLFLLLLIPMAAQAGTISRPNYNGSGCDGSQSFTAGCIPSADEWNDSFDNIYDEFNGSIESVNIADGTIATADLANSSVTVGKLSISNGEITTEWVDDHSTDAAEQQTATSPGTTGSESLATHLAGELERLRYAIKRLGIGTTMPVATLGWIDLPIAGPNLIYHGSFEATSGDGDASSTSAPEGWTVVGGPPTWAYSAASDTAYGDGIELSVTSSGGAGEGISQVLTNLPIATTYIVIARAKANASDFCEIVTSNAATNIASGDVRTTTTGSFETLVGRFVTDGSSLDTVTVQFLTVNAADVCEWDHLGVYATTTDPIPRAEVKRYYAEYASGSGSLNCAATYTGDCAATNTNLSLTVEPAYPGSLIHVFGRVELETSVNNDECFSRLYDGSNVLDEARFTVDAPGGVTTMGMKGTIVNPTVGTALTVTLDARGGSVGDCDIEDNVNSWIEAVVIPTGVTP